MFIDLKRLKSQIIRIPNCINLKLFEMKHTINKFVGKIGEVPMQYVNKLTDFYKCSN